MFHLSSLNASKSGPKLAKQMICGEFITYILLSYLEEQNKPFLISSKAQ